MTPKLRFPEFTDAWQVKKLGDLTRKKLTNGVFNDPSKVGAGYRLVNVKDMYIDGFLSGDGLTQVAIEDKEFERNKVEYGDLFFTRSSLVKDGIAYTNLYIENDDDVTFDGHLIKMTPDVRISDPYFLYYISKTDTVRKQLVSMSNTTTMTTIGQAEVASVQIHLSTLKEQEKIAGFLTAIDDRISVIDKKVELLRQYKKGVMQKIFTQQIRFKDEKGQNYPAWQQKKLGNLASITAGRKDVNAGNPNGQYRFYTCAKNYTHSDSYSFEGEAIMIAGNAEVGLCQYYNGKFEAYQRTYVLQNFKLSGSFLFKYLSHYFRDYAVGLKQTGAMSFIKIGMLTNFGVPVPSEKEQQKIVDFLSSLDDKVKAEEAKLTAAQKFKKSLLQRMLV